MLLEPEKYQFFAEIDLFMAQDAEGVWYAFSPTFGVITKQPDSYQALGQLWHTILSRVTEKEDHDGEA